MTIGEAVRSLQTMASNSPSGSKTELYVCLDNGELEYQSIISMELDPNQTFGPRPALGLIHIKGMEMKW